MAEGRGSYAGGGVGLFGGAGGVSRVRAFLWVSSEGRYGDRRGDMCPPPVFIVCRYTGEQDQSSFSMCRTFMR